MSIFSVIAEAKIQDWFRRKSTGEIEQPAILESIDTVKSAETYLLEDILELIEKASNADPEKRELLIQKSRQMELQLLTTLEKDGYNLMSQMTAKTIQDHRKRFRPESSLS